jgi:hypothetical protein
MTSSKRRKGGSFPPDCLGQRLAGAPMSWLAGNAGQPRCISALLPTLNLPRCSGCCLPVDLARHCLPHERRDAFGVTRGQAPWTPSPAPPATDTECPRYPPGGLIAGPPYPQLGFSRGMFGLLRPPEIRFLGPGQGDLRRAAATQRSAPSRPVSRGQGQRARRRQQYPVAHTAPSPSRASRAPVRGARGCRAGLPPGPGSARRPSPPFAAVQTRGAGSARAWMCVARIPVSCSWSRLSFVAVGAGRSVWPALAACAARGPARGQGGSARGPLGDTGGCLDGGPAGRQLRGGPAAQAFGNLASATAVFLRPASAAGTARRGWGIHKRPGLVLAWCHGTAGDGDDREECEAHPSGGPCPFLSLHPPLNIPR